MMSETQRLNFSCYSKQSSEYYKPVFGYFAGAYAL